MSNIKTTSIIAIALFAAMMTVGAIVMSLDTNQAAFAKKHKHNDADQALFQGQGSDQSSSCSSKNNTAGSCNNIALEFNNNTGNEVVGQQ